MKGRNPQLLLLGIAFGIALVRLVTASPEDPCGPGGEGHQVDGVALCTHGNDAPPPGVDTTDLPSTDDLWLARYGVAASDTTEPQPLVAATNNVACVGNGTDGPRVKVLYARASDTPSRFAAVMPLLRQYAADADDAINVSAGQRGEGRRLRFETDSSCRVAVTSVALSASGDDSFASMRSELRAKGFNQANRKYLVFMDAAVGICGLGEVYRDERPDGLQNLNNTGLAMYARVDTACWPHAATHELMHTLGGVQDGAPHTTGVGHCKDERDVMCYSDAPGVSTFVACSGALETQVDCNHDDYFNPRPGTTSYLASHWNTANSRYLQAASAPPPPVRAELSVPIRGYAGAPRWVSATLRIPDKRTVRSTWSVTRSECRFDNPSRRSTTLRCPVTIAGQAEVKLTVRDSKGQTAMWGRTIKFVRPSAARATTMALRLSDGSVKAGRRVVLTGRFVDRATGRPIFGMPVTIYKLVNGGRSWQQVATRRTAPRGFVRLSVYPRRATTYVMYSSTTSTWRYDASPQRLVRVYR